MAKSGQKVGSLTEAWAGQHEVYPDGQWAREMWDGFLDPQRVHLVKAIQTALQGAGQPPESILEVGCGSGPNLRLCHAVWPSADLTGVDVNEAGLTWGRAQAWREGWDWIGLQRDLRAGELSGTLHDVVFSCYTLTYLDAPDMVRVLGEMIRLAKHAVVIMEPMVSYGTPEVCYGGHMTKQQGYPEIWYDYLTRLSSLASGRVMQCDIAPMPVWGHLNGVVTVVPVSST